MISVETGGQQLTSSGCCVFKFVPVAHLVKSGEEIGVAEAGELDDTRLDVAPYRPPMPRSKFLLSTLTWGVGASGWPSFVARQDTVRPRIGKRGGAWKTLGREDE